MRVKSIQSRRPARAALGVAPAKDAETAVPEGKVKCPGCRKPVRYRGEGKLAGTLYSHRNDGIPCRFGTPASVYGIEAIIVDLEGLLGL